MATIMELTRLDEPRTEAPHSRSAPLPVPEEKRFIKETRVAAANEVASKRLSVTPPGDHSPLHGNSPARDLADEVPEDMEDVFEADPSSPFAAHAFKNHPYARPGPMMDTGKEARKRMKIRRVPFNGRILMIGCGAVAQCLLPLLPRMIDMPLDHIQIVDIVDMSAKIRQHLDLGMKFTVEQVNKANMTAILDKYLRSGDLLIDLAYEIPTLNFLEWCRAHNVLYMNAALEVDNPYHVANPAEVTKFTLYQRHQELEKRIAEWGRNDGPSAVIEHGANPGLVSHFVKQGLVHIAQELLRDGSVSRDRAARLRALLEARDFPRLAQELDVKAIHISERDTQVTSQPKRPGEFVNTWSPMGFFQEGIAPAELGWGTHEKTLPTEAVTHATGPQHQICLRTKGINTHVRTWVPSLTDDGNVQGMVVRHGEAYTIPQHLAVYDEDGECVYRPTCHYAYCPSDAAISSLHELRARAYKVQPKTRVLRDDIVEGTDALGCLLLGHDLKAWWIGTVLDIHEARELIPNQNATTVQVAVGLCAAAQWMIQNPRQGVRVPDELPYDNILEASLPFLGAFLSIPVNWTPLEAAKREHHAEYRVELAEQHKEADAEDHWQFSSFLVQ